MARRRRHGYPEVEITFKENGSKENVQFVGLSSKGKSIKIIRNNKTEYLQKRLIEYKEV